MAGLVLLDVDQDPATGLPAPELGGAEGQDVGVEFFIDVFVPEGIGFVVSTDTFEVVAEVELVVEGNAISFAVPLDSLNQDEGAMNVAVWFSDFITGADRLL